MRISDWSSDVCSSDLVQPLSKRVSSALPCGVIDSMTASRSDFSKHLSPGNANQADTRRSPTTALARRSAARRISAPSGIVQELEAKDAPAWDAARSPPLDRLHQPAIHRPTADRKSNRLELQTLMRISNAV